MDELSSFYLWNALEFGRNSCHDGINVSVEVINPIEANILPKNVSWKCIFGNYVILDVMSSQIDNNQS